MGFIFTTARTEEVQLVCMSSENHQTNDTYHFRLELRMENGHECLCAEGTEAA